MNRPDDVDFGFDIPVRTELPRTHWMALAAYATANGTTVAALLRATAVHILNIAGAAAIDAATPAPVRPVPPAPVHVPAPSVPDDEPAAELRCSEHAVFRPRHIELGFPKNVTGRLSEQQRTA